MSRLIFLRKNSTNIFNQLLYAKNDLIKKRKEIVDEINI